jgi:hypothetical protein
MFRELNLAGVYSPTLLAKAGQDSITRMFRELNLAGVYSPTLLAKAGQDSITRNDSAEFDRLCQVEQTG